MKRRLVIFKGQTGWFMTPEFFGDKNELAKESKTKSCDETWTMIARKFTQAKTKEEFSEVNAWAQGLYHDSETPAQPQEICTYTLPETLPDEVLVVYEDLGVTGIQMIADCSVCGRTHFLVYNPDKTIEDDAVKCQSCASKLIVHGAIPSIDAWKDALEMYRKPAPSYRMAIHDDFPEIKKTLLEYAAKKQDKSMSREELEASSKTWLAEIMKDSNAASHMGAPVKLLKIVEYTGGEFIFQVLFRDWSTAVVRSRFLKSLQ